jgi:hypothetical protein
VIDERIQGEIQITVIATGFELKAHHQRPDQYGEALKTPFETTAARAGASLPSMGLGQQPQPAAKPLAPSVPGAQAPGSMLPPKLEEPQAWKTPQRSSNSMTEAARKLLDLPDFLRPKK